ncbi:MAG: hypothetical protein JWO07_553 [Candidatus Saccharibacteria bacterium]|nr:hypothetical protein [Candidatus Saccharibacteria bacterium]
MYLSPLFQQFLIGLAILTSMGTLVQDTRINKALEVTVPLSNVSVNISSNLDGLNEAASAHTHVEQTAVTQELAGIPRVQARDDHRRYTLPKYSSRSNAYFGDSQILWPST